MLVQMNNSKVFFKYRLKAFLYQKVLLLVICTVGFDFLFAQNTLPLADLSYFQSPGPSWKLAGDVRSTFTQKDVLTTTPGTGILVNFPDKKNPGKDLISNIQHGDLDMELDYMMAMASNSGIYMQGRYEIQLLDSWGRYQSYGRRQWRYL